MGTLVLKSESHGCRCDDFRHITLRELLDNCACLHRARRDIAWVEFLRRYKKFIYSQIYKRCSQWQIPRLHRQLAEVVNDVVGEVFHTLCRSNCRAIREYQKRDSEHAFLCWLSTVCRNTSDNVVSKEFNKAHIEESAQEVPKVYCVEIERDWELYDDVVTILQASSAAKMENRERDIRIFSLFIWGGYPAKLIQKKNRLGHRVVNNVIHRLRKELKARAFWLS